jgi:hypothetical protein
MGELTANLAALDLDDLSLRATDGIVEFLEAFEAAFKHR